MAQPGLPDEVRKLIADHIVSVEQLEILLLLRRSPDREWTARAVADEIRTSELSAANRLADLRSRGLLAARDDGATLYRYDPPDQNLARAVAALADAYRERRFSIIELIFSKPIDNLRLYADAFRIRKEDGGG